MFALKSKSTRGNTIFQVFVSDKGFVAVYSIKLQEQFRTVLHCFVKQVGVPDSLVIDDNRSQTINEVKQSCDQVDTTLKILETGTPWENRAEFYIGLLKEAVRKDLQASNAPMDLWDYSI